MKLKLKYLALNLTIMILENKEDDHANEKLSKTDETNNLEKFANTRNPLLMN